jgi:N-acyl-D-amino-acid deacylase
MTLQDPSPGPHVRSRRPIAVILVLACGLVRWAGADEAVPRREVEDAVVRGLRVVQKAAESYPNHRACFSCHHQTLPMLAMVAARDRGVPIDAGLLQAQADFSRESFRERSAVMEQGKGIGGGAMTVGYGLWALLLAARGRDEVSGAMVSFLLKTRRPDGRWATGTNRPPMEESSLTCTALGALGLRAFAPSDRREEAEAAIGKARDWLLGAEAKNQEDRCSKLWGLLRLGAGAEAVRRARDEALAPQRDDGGWPSRDDLPSDAYATGQTLARLHEAGLSASHPSFRKGLRYLLDAQHEDGSWKVETRSRPVQTFFDNGDPHGKHQFISIPATCWAVVALTTALGPQPEPFDLVIRNGKVVDGTGNPWYLADVAIRGDRIAEVGRIAPDAPARRTIDARGLVVAPGFIDMHSHSDRPLLVDGDAQSKIRQGVTTEVLGEDTSGGPSKGKRPPETFRRDGKTLEWTTFGGYLDALEEGGIATNVASYVGLGTLLGCVLGDALDRPDARQLDELKALLAEALDEGAFGLSTMLASPRELNVTTDDLVALGRVVRERGGIYSSHIRNEGTGVLDAVKEAIAIGERAGIPVDVIHLKIADQALWGRMREVVALIDDARRRGVNVQAHVYPYTRGNNDLASIIPPWAHEGGREALLSRLRDPSQRARMKADIRDGLPGWYNHFTAVGGDWSRMLVSARLGESNRRFQGMTVDRIFAEKARGISPPPDPLDQLFDLLIEERGSISTIYAHHTEEDMNLALVQPWCSIGSDGSALATSGPLRAGHPHPRNFGTFPRVLGVYVRERHLLSLEDAVRKMTSLNAAKLGIADRGLLRPGQFADVSVFDPETVIDHATYLDPFRYNEGISYVVVNGRLVLDRGQHTGARPGRALRAGRGGS